MIKQTFKYKAISLLEVIVVLAVISLTMVSSLTVVIRANLAIKDNEVQDGANDLLVQVYELIRNPEPLNVKEGLSNLSQVDRTTIFAVRYETSGDMKGFLTRMTVPLSNSCISGTQYDVRILGEDEEDGVPICIQLDITPRSSGGGVINKYDVTITLLYSLSTGIVRDVYTLNRFDKFVQVI